jgi:hypothetical protein
MVYAEDSVLLNAIAADLSAATLAAREEWLRCEQVAPHGAQPQADAAAAAERYAALIRENRARRGPRFR